MKSLAEPISQAFENFARQLRVSMPARVNEYDFNEQRATVQPLLRRRFSDGDVQELPIISHVPVIFPRSGQASLTMPVEPGDTVLLIFSDRSLDRWLTGGGMQTPDDRRMHSLTDAVAIPGIVSFADFSDIEPPENNEDTVLRYKDSKLTLRSNGDIVIEPSSQNVTIDGNLNVTGDINADGDVEAGDISLENHVHGGVESGGATTEPPQ